MNYRYLITGSIIAGLLIAPASFSSNRNGNQYSDNCVVYKNKDDTYSEINGNLYIRDENGILVFAGRKSANSDFDRNYYLYYY